MIYFGVGDWFILTTNWSKENIAGDLSQVQDGRERWYQELVGFNFALIHKKGKENSNADALSRSLHMAEAPPLAEDKYAEFYEIDKPVIIEDWKER